MSKNRYMKDCEYGGAPFHSPCNLNEAPIYLCQSCYQHKQAQHPDGKGGTCFALLSAGECLACGYQPGDDD